MAFRLDSLSRFSAMALPWLTASVIVALAVLSLTGYPIGRPYLLFPTLLLVAVATLLLRSKAKADIGFCVGASMGLYILVLMLNTALNHAELVTPVFYNAIIMLILPWALFMSGWRSSSLLDKPRAIFGALLITEIIIVGQIWYSYYTGWGEVIDMGDSIRRAYGSGGDSFSVVLVFLILLNLLRGNVLRSALALTALFMSAGKMGLGLVMLGVLLALPLLLGQRRQQARLCLGLMLGVVLGLGLTTHKVRSFFAAQAPAVVSAPVSVASVPPRNLIEHLAVGATATGLGRIITAGAGYEIFRQYPLAGVGYGQSDVPAIFQPAVMADSLHLQENFGVIPERLAAERAIGNQTLMVAAEEGVIGMLPYLLFCICAVMLAVKVWRQACQQAMADNALANTAAIWVICLIIFNQTAPWLLSGSAMTVWLAFALGLCAAQLHKQAA